ncbi:MAG: protein kinase domain-containing protein [Pirellula sp.]
MPDIRQAAQWLVEKKLVAMEAISEWISKSKPTNCSDWLDEQVKLGRIPKSAAEECKNAISSSLDETSDSAEGLSLDETTSIVHVEESAATDLFLQHDSEQSTMVRNEHHSGSSGSSLNLTTGDSTRFKIRRQFAQGGLGVIYLARDNQFQRDVALKQIRDDRNEHIVVSDKFLFEAEVTGQLEHPGIVPVYSMGLTPEGKPYYAMRFIRGIELKAAIRELHESKGKKQLDYYGVEFRSLLQRFISVCQTIAYAHKRGVLHRDLKPANIMLGPYGETLVVDWGLARPLQTQPAEEIDLSDSQTQYTTTPIKLRLSKARSETQHGSFSGTAAYAPPEQLLGELDRLGFETDVYSLGAILFELLTNEPSVRGKFSSLKEIVEYIRTDPGLDPRTIVPSIPRPLAMICRKSLSFRKEDRYTTPMDLASDIERWLADERVKAIGTLETPFELAARLLRRYKSWTLSIATALIITIVVTATGAILINQSRIREKQAKNEAQANKKDAVDRIAIARNAIDNLLIYSTELLDEQPAAKQLQIRLTEAAEADYARLSEGVSNDKELELERIRALVRLADLDHMQFKYESAQEKYKEAIEKLEQDSPKKEPQPSEYFEWMLEKGKTIARIALAMDLEDKYTESKKQFERSIELLRRIAQEADDKDYPILVLSRTLAQYGDLLVRVGDVDLAINSLRESIDLQKVQSTHPQTRRTRWTTQRSLSQALSLLGKRKEAFDMCRDILTQMESSSDKQAREERERRASLYFTMANLHRGDGRYLDAIDYLQQAYVVYIQLSEESPDDPRYLLNRDMSSLDIGLIWIDLGQPTPARPLFEQSVASLVKLSNTYPLVNAYKESLASALSGLGRVEMLQNVDGTIALQYFDDTKAIATLLADPSEDDAANPYWRLLAAAYCQHSTALARVGKWELMDIDYTESMKYFQKLILQFPQDSTLVFSRIQANWSQGWERRNGQREDADKFFTKSIDELERLVNSPNNQEEYEHRLAHYLLRYPNRKEESLKLAESYARSAVQKQPNDFRYALTLAEAQAWLGLKEKAIETMSTLKRPEYESIEWYATQAVVFAASDRIDEAKSELASAQRLRDEMRPYDWELNHFLVQIQAQIDQSR